MKLNKKSVIIFSILLLIIISIVVFVIIKNNNKNNDQPTINISEDNKETPKVKIIDTSSKSRPYAVAINNAAAARPYQAGLSEAYIVYEFIAEGGVTRYLALYKDANAAKIGSVRSARHYFIDYALENDAIFVHWGFSPQAQSDISTLKINNINGLYDEGTYFYRDKTLSVSSEHTGYTSMELLKNAASKKGYNLETNKSPLLNYTVNEVDLSKKEGSREAKTITIKYSNYATNKYVYDEENKYYLRFVNDKIQSDYNTKEQLHFKNIIVYQVKNYTIAGDDKDRQEFENIGEGKGYFITNGYAQEITWSKKSRSEQTIYKYLDGRVIDVSDGNTFIQIQPKGQQLTIE